MKAHLKRLFSKPPFGLGKQEKPSAPSRTEQLAERWAQLNKKRRILIVDDDKCLQEIFQRMQRSCPMDVVAAGNVQEAKECLSGEPFDLLVIDYNIPNGHPAGRGNGGDLVLWIKHHFPNANVVILTGANKEVVSLEMEKRGESVPVYEKPTNDSLEFVAQFLTYAGRRPA